MDGIKPPTPPKDLEVFFCPFFRKAISEANNLWYNILEVIQTGKYHRERAEYKSHISNPAYISKTNLILFYGRCIMLIFAGPVGDRCIIFKSKA